MSTKSPLEIVQAMEHALQTKQVDVSDYFHDDFVWDGNYGCGIKHGLAAFERDWYAPFRACFGDREFVTDHWMQDGDWAACFGTCHATLRHEFMGVKATGQRIRIPYIDFWRIQDGKIIQNKVSVDYAHVLSQLGRDVFDGHGWEKFDRGEETAPVGD